MASFVVMEPPARSGDRPPAYVRDGFHWLAFLFTPIWLLVHRLWVEALVAIAVMAALSALGMAPGFEFAASIMSLLVALYIGLDAADLRVEALRRRGWRQWGVVDAENRGDAEVRHLQADFAGEHVPAPPPPSATLMPPQPSRTSGPALGLFSYPGGR